ncbi:MAG: hypothetical protein K6A71_11515 [Lachnospiraceae bacterium]|nr:hypothetical protein [Lachnospiraceae bacterium]
MFNYIKHEIDRAVLSKSARIYFAGIFILCILGNIAVVGFRTIYGTNEGTYAYNIMEYAAWSFIVPYLSCILIVHMIFGSDYPNPHIKDGLTAGLNRTQIYLCKLAASVVLAFIFLVICFVALVSLTALFQMNDKTLGADAVRTFCGKMFLALPLFLAGVSFGTMFMFGFRVRKKAYIGYYLVTLVVPQLILFLAKDPPGLTFFKAVRPYIISQCFRLIPYPSSPERSVPLIIGLGFLYTIASTVVGIVVYNRKKFLEA